MIGARAGVSLLEALVALIILAAGLLAMVSTAAFVALGVPDAEPRAELVAAVQHAIEGELRELSAAGDDLIAADSLSIAFRGYRKPGVVCRLDAAAGWLDVWELGEPFTARAPADSLYIFADGDPAVARDDSWVRAAVTATEPAPSCGAWEAYPSRRLHVGPAALARVHAGAPVRSFETVSYGIRPIDGVWMLARTQGAAAPVGLIGPLAAPTERGLRFRYFTADEAEIAAPVAATARAAVARVAVLVRQGGPGHARRDGPPIDPLELRVALDGPAWR